MRPRPYLIAATLLATLCFISGNLLVQKVFSGARADFTENNLYTLSGATTQTLRDVSEPLELTFFYTRAIGQDYPAVRAYAARVRELLTAYESRSGGRVRITEIDPKPFSEAEDLAVEAGITAISTDGDDPLYFGIAGRNAIDDLRVIPFLAPERELTLEYDLTRMIARLDDPEPPRVGILSSLPGLSSRSPEGGSALLQEIRKSFTVEIISDEFRAMPEDLDVLMVAHPGELTARQEWLIDQFILREGRAIFIVDPAVQTVADDGVFSAGNPPTRSDLGKLGQAWGVTLSQDAVADAVNGLIVPVDTGGGRIEELAHPLFIGALAGDMNLADLVTADLTRTVNFGAPGAFVTSTLQDGTVFTPLITTSPSPSYIDAAKAMRQMSPGDVLKEYETAPGALTLAGRLSGNLTSAFPAGPPALQEPDDPVLAELARAEAANAPPHVTGSVSAAEIIMIADVDLLADGFYIVPDSTTVVADNSVLVLNALDALSGGGELSRLRSRAASIRPMKRIDDMAAVATEKYYNQQTTLRARLDTAQRRLEELQEIGSQDGFFAGDLEADLSSEERQELTMLRDDIVELRGRLRDIERDFRRDIDRLEFTLKAINIWGGPALVAFIGLLVWRRQRRIAKRSES